MTAEESRIADLARLGDLTMLVPDAGRAERSRERCRSRLVRRAGRRARVEHMVTTTSRVGIQVALMVLSLIYAVAFIANVVLVVAVLFK